MNFKEAIKYLNKREGNEVICASNGVRYQNSANKLYEAIGGDVPDLYDLLQILDKEFEVVE